MSGETTPLSGRLYGYVISGSDGRTVLRLSRKPMPRDDAMAVLIFERAHLPNGMEAEIDIVSDPSLDPSLTGPEGPNGWTPLLTGEADGTRTVLRVTDWTGGKGAKPPTGYVGGSGATGLVDKAGAFNFNAVKRVDIFGGTTGTGGISTIIFDPPFATVPAKVLPSAMPNVLAGPVRAEVVAGTLTKTGCQVKVTTAALLSGVVSALVGASVSVIVIEA